MLYQSADPEVALAQARKSAEAICKNIYVREGLEESGKPVAKMMLNDLISVLASVAILPSHISVSLGTIQAFGNLDTHDQGDESDFITVEYIKPCLQALDTVVHWYFMRYSQEGLLFGRDRSSPSTSVLIGNEKVYFDVLEMAFVDSVIEDRERVLLDRRREDLGISLVRAKQIAELLATRGSPMGSECALAEDFDDLTDEPLPSGPVARDIWLEIVRKKLVAIPSGAFRMGSESGQESEKPVHEVTLQAVYMAKYPVTQIDFERILGINPSNFTGDQHRPVENVSWFDAVKYRNKLSKVDGLEPVYSVTDDGIITDFSRNGYRLPTEAEWEYACRSGTSTAYYWGDDENDARFHAWYDANSEDVTHVVGAKRKNAFGLFDMVGNVWEWTSDFFSSDYYGSRDDTDPTGPECGEFKVLRGGCWFDGPNRLRSSCRLKRAPNPVDDVTRFRVAARWQDRP